MEEKSIFKKSKALLSIIVLGSIGSGLWEIFLKDFIFFMGNTFVNVVTFIYSGYIDSLYKNVGKGDYLAIYPSLFIFVAFILMPFFFITKISFVFRRREMKIDNEPSIENFKDKFFAYLFEKKIRTYLFIFIIFLPVSVIYTDVIIKETSTFVSCRSIERNLEIIRPFISDKDYIVLRSDYRKIDNREKLVLLINKINIIAVKNKQIIPKYDLFGI